MTKPTYTVHQVLVSRERRSGTSESSEPNSRSVHSITPYNDLISFLGVAQYFQLDMLPVIWHAELEDAFGGTSQILRSLVNSRVSFAFKRPLTAEREDMDDSPVFARLVSEISVLEHPAIRMHPNVVSLRGICWHAKTHRSEHRIWPVLVFDKADYGNITTFLGSHRGLSMSIRDRLDLCLGVGEALATMHAYGAVHGDIKPDNVLVLPKADKSPDCSGVIAKLTDFGFSQFFSGDRPGQSLPKSEPWNAPEHHFRPVEFYEGVDADNWCYALFCLWVLFHGKPGFPDLDQFKTGRAKEELRGYACSLTKCEKALYKPVKEILHNMFSCFLMCDPRLRVGNIGQFLFELGSIENNIAPSPSDPSSSLPTTLFSLVPSIHNFYIADFRLRVCICNTLMRLCSRSPAIPDKSNLDIAFQLALCLKIGFGCQKDEASANDYLGLSKRSQDDLTAALSQAKSSEYVNRSMRYQDINFHSDVSPFQTLKSTYDLPLLRMAQDEWNREIPHVSDLLGVAHPTLLVMKELQAVLLIDLWQLKDAESLLAELIKDSKSSLGVGDSATLKRIAHLADIYCCQGHHTTAENCINEAMVNASMAHSEPGIFTQSLVGIYIAQGRWSKAERLANKVIKQCIIAKGEEHPHTMDALSCLATIARGRGNIGQAASLDTRVHELKRKILGQDKADTLEALENQSYSLRGKGDVIKARDLEKDLVMKSEKLLGTEHPDTVRRKANLGSVLSEMRNFDEAVVIEEDVLEFRRSKLGDSHRDTLRSMSNLGATFREMHRFEDALPLLEKAHARSKDAFGEDHLDTLKYAHNLMWAYDKLGRLDEAVTLGEYIFQTEVRKLGQSNPFTMRTASALALVYAKKGMLSKAQELQAETLELGVKVLGKEHPVTLESTDNLALTYLNQGKHEVARRIFKGLVNLSPKVLGPDDPVNGVYLSHLALSYQKLGQYRESEKLLSTVLKWRREHLGHTHVDTLDSMHSLALVYKFSEKEDLAIGAFKEVNTLKVEVLGISDESTIKAANSLQMLYKKQHRWDDAQQVAIQVRDARTRTVGADHPDTLTTMFAIAFYQRRLGHIQEALDLNQLVLKGQRKHYGQDQGKDTILKTLKQLSICCKELQMWEGVRSFQQEIVDILTLKQEPNDPEALMAQDQLGLTLVKLSDFDTAREMQLNTLERSREAFGEVSQKTMIFTAHLATTSREMGDWDEYQRLLEKLLNLRQQVLGFNDPKTEKTRLNLSDLRNRLHESHLHRGDSLDLA